MMKNQHAQEAAKILFDYRLNRLSLDSLPNNLIPLSQDDAYLIQNELKFHYLSLQNNFSIGKKVGCTSTDGQKQLDINEPFYGNLFSRYSIVDPDEISSKKFNHPFIEPEIALRIKKDIDISKAPYSIKDSKVLFDGIVCALEIVDFRFNKNLKNIGALNLIATNGASEFWIRDSKVHNLETINFENHEVSISFNDNIIAKGNTNSVMGNPLNSALWIINKLAKKGETLLKGQFISTGTCTKAHELISNTKISANFGKIGKIEFNYK